MAAEVDVLEALRGEHVVITGATGFIGKVLVEKLLWSVPAIGGLSLLIRADDTAAAERRLRREIFESPAMARLRALHGEGWETWAAGKVEAVAGDLGQDRFGLDGQTYGALCRRADRVVACAATVKFDERLDRAVELNARGAVRTLELAHDAGDVPLVHVSTCFVSGGRRGRVPEALPDALGLDAGGTLAALGEACRAARAAAAGATLRDAPFVAAGAEQARRHGFADVYTLTKALAEALIAGRRGAVPLTIVRPAIVESALAEPIPGWLQAVRVVDPLLVAYGCGLARELPGAPDVPLEIVPVDYVVNVLLVALADLPPGGAPEGEGATGAGLRVYQVGSARNPLTLGELMGHAREGFRRTPLRDADGEPILPPEARFTDPELLHRRLSRRLRHLRGRPRRWARVGTGRRAAAPALAVRRLEHFLSLIEVYRPYLTHGATYGDTATRRLWQRLSPAQRREFPFDVSAIDWRRYIARTHVAGLVRFALGADTGAPAAEETGPATASPAVRLAQGVAVARAAGSLHELFAAVAERHPDTPFVQTYRDGAWLRYSYAQARTAAANVAWRMARDHGVGGGDRVVLWAGGGPEWVVAALAAWRLGAVVVPLDPQWPADEAAAAARLVNARLACAAPGKVAALGGRLDDGGGRRGGARPCPVVALAAPFVPEPGVGPLPGAGEQAAAGGGIGRVGGSDLAAILFTSGTTVEPKAVPLTHGNYLANVRDLVPVMELCGERLLSLLPVHHAFEQTVGLLVPMAGASTFSYVAEIRPEEIRWMMATTRPTMMVAVPRLLGLLHAGILRSVEEGGPALRGLFRGLFALSRLTGGRIGHKLFSKVHRRFGGALRRIATGGAALDPALGESFRWMGFQVAEGYGMTETGPVLTVNPWSAIRFGSVGKPLPGVEIELRPPRQGGDGEVGGGEPGSGEIWVRGANVMGGYLDNPDATAEVLRDGWLNTGDVGRFDADGYLYLCGRTKDVIITAAGKNVHPQEVEYRYRDLPGVEELVVLGLPAPGGGELVAAVVVPHSGCAPEELEEIRAAVARRSALVPSYQRISRLEVWRGDLPKTTTQKVQRGRLLDAIMAGNRGPAATAVSPGTGGPVAAPTPASAAEAWVVETLARLTHTRPDRLGPGTRLSELGLDSLTRVELLGELEARAGRPLDAGFDFAALRLRDLARFLPA